MYVVRVTTDVLGGFEVCNLLATSNLKKVVDTARSVEKYGFNFFHSKTGVGVEYLADGRVYTAHERPPIIFSMKKRGGKWVETWHDQEQKDAYEIQLRRGTELLAS